MILKSERIYNLIKPFNSFTYHPPFKQTHIKLFIRVDHFNIKSFSISPLELSLSTFNSYTILSIKRFKY